MSDSSPAKSVNLFFLAIIRFLETYFLHRWLYLLPILLMLIGGAVSIVVSDLEYVSKGVITVKRETLIESIASVRDEGFGWVTPAQATVDEINELLQTDAFIRLIIQPTGLEENMDDGDIAVAETIEEVREALSVSTQGSNQIEVRATYNNPQTAFELADAAMNSFIEWQINADKQDTLAARNFLEELAPQYKDEYDEAVSELETYLLQHPEPLRGDRPALEELQIERLRAAVDLANTRYIDTLENLENVKLEEVTAEGTTRQTYSIVDNPRVPREPETGPLDIVVEMTIFLAVGVILTLAAVVINALTDTAMRYPIDVRYAVGQSVLATIPPPPESVPAGETAAESIDEAAVQEENTSPAAAANL